MKLNDIETRLVNNAIHAASGNRKRAAATLRWQADHVRKVVLGGNVSGAIAQDLDRKLAIADAIADGRL